MGQSKKRNVVLLAVNQAAALSVAVWWAAGAWGRIASGWLLPVRLVVLLMAAATIHGVASFVLLLVMQPLRKR